MAAIQTSLVKSSGISALASANLNACARLRCDAVPAIPVKISHPHCAPCGQVQTMAAGTAENSVKNVTE